MKARTLCKKDGSFKALIETREQYEKVRVGEWDWKDHVKAKIKSIEIPFDIFMELVEMDRDRINAKVQEAIDKGETFE